MNSARVSDAGQHAENQVPDLMAWAQRCGVEVVVTYQFQESAWKGAHQKQLSQVYRDARSGKFPRIEWLFIKWLGLPDGSEVGFAWLVPFN